MLGQSGCMICFFNPGQSVHSSQWVGHSQTATILGRDGHQSLLYHNSPTRVASDLWYQVHTNILSSGVMCNVKFHHEQKVRMGKIKDGFPWTNVDLDRCKIKCDCDIIKMKGGHDFIYHFIPETRNVKFEILVSNIIIEVELIATAGGAAEQ